MKTFKILDVYSFAMEQLYDILSHSLEKVFNAESLDAEKIDFLVEEPETREFGDFATNIAMVAAKEFKMPPLVLAEKIVKNINIKDSYFSSLEIKKPGFLNFFLDNSWYCLAIEKILSLRDSFGFTEFGQGKSVVIEFVSANPTGPMHIGNARGGAIGDSLAECFKFAGFCVKKEFYVNDAGNQIEKFKKSLNIRYERLFNNAAKNDELPMPDDCYQGEDILEHAKNFAKLYGDGYIKSTEESRKEALLNFALPINIQNLKNDLLNYKIEYDNWFFESSLYKDASVLKIISMLEEKGYTYKKDGAVWFDFKKCGGAKDEVLIRDNGIPTYFASDIAYHYNKFKIRNFDKAIDVCGADHHGHISRLKAALFVLGIDYSKLDVIIMQMVRLVKNGKTLKLSKRAGNSVTLNYLMELIPVDVARFFFNLKEPNSHFDFDLDLACEESDKNPVYYVQYAYVRICGILHNLKKLGFEFSPKADFSLLKTSQEKYIIKLISKFPYEIIEAVRSYNPSRIARYSIDLATQFHKFYVLCKIKGQASDVIHARLGLCEAVRIVLKNCFSILKIEVMSEMK